MIALGLGASPGNAAESSGRATKPFKYTYRITDLTVTAEERNYG